MNRLVQTVARLLAQRDDIRLLSQRGQTMTEYVILLVWIVLLIFAALTTLGRNLSHMLSSTAARV